MLQVIEKTMTPEQFVYWLQGFVEVDSAQCSPDERQWKIITDHLKQVFDKRTPNYTTTFTPTPATPITIPNQLPPTGNPVPQFIC